MDTSDLKKGLKFIYDGQPWVCVDFQFVKPGKGQAFTRTKMRHLLTGSTVEKNIRSNEKIALADAEDRSLHYIYQDGEVRAELAEPFDTLLDKQLHQRALQLAKQPPAKAARGKETVPADATRCKACTSALS